MPHILDQEEIIDPVRFRHFGTGMRRVEDGLFDAPKHTQTLRFVGSHQASQDLSG
jgi:hypothetical protein